MAHITCSRCGEKKDVVDFLKRYSGGKSTIRKTCKRCYYVSQRNYKRKNRAKNKDLFVLDLNFHKTCSSCKKTKHAKQFGTSRNEKDGVTHNCSECRKLQWDKHKDDLKIRYGSYRRSARRRNIEFSISLEEFDCLTLKKCSYCGTINKYNGIDREDNNLGYVTNNCVACCSTCNTMKWQLSKEKFVHHIRKILLFLDGNNE